MQATELAIKAWECQLSIKLNLQKRSPCTRLLFNFHKGGFLIYWSGTFQKQHLQDLELLPIPKTTVYTVIHMAFERGVNF